MRKVVFVAYGLSSRRDVVFFSGAPGLSVGVLLYPLRVVGVSAQLQTFRGIYGNAHNYTVL